MNSKQLAQKNLMTIKCKTEMLYRHTVLDQLVREDRSFELSFSSEEPVERFFGLEILDHKPESVKLDWLNSGHAPLLLDHDPTKQIGIVEAAEITSDGKARGKIRFGKSSLAEAAYQDVLDGIKSNISVGYCYLPNGIVLEQESKGDNPNIYRINKWKPLEVSLVSIPADHTVGIGRNQLEIIANNMINMRENMQNEVIENSQPSITVNTEQITKDIRQNEATRLSEILTIGDKHNMHDMAIEFIREGKSIDAFRQKVLEILSNNPIINTTSPKSAIIGMSTKEARSFSILRAIRATVTGNWSDAELEKEASMAVAKKINREPSSFFVPLDVNLEQIEQRSYVGRTLEKLSNVAGGYLVSTDYLSNNFIELLRNKMLVKQMGAKVMSGLHGDVAIPKQTGGATTFWVSEGRGPEHSEQAFAQVTLSPKSIAAYTDFTRKLVLQSSPDIENLVRSDLATVIALEVDRAAISGRGIGAEPLGILNTVGIGNVTFDDDNPISWGNIVDLESLIAAGNADIGTLGYLCNANIRGILKQTEKAEGTAQFVWESSSELGFGYLNGYRVGTTNQIPADTILFGNFADLIIGQWGVLDVLVDPYTLGTSGGIRIRVMQDVDIAVRHAESFAVLTRQ
ncbi:phage major capsid protein [Candidatus Tisiphia endosymbiont of Myopa tessellatipennis]|uniref:phage major capsid protein n=1 Tax=Candidatus Tisiphia endosymbiont of Myopa tessellatipennis TaxID=3066257 RepID=UPI00313B4BF4